LTDEGNTTALAPALSATRSNFHTRSGVKMAFYADTSADGIPLLLVHSINAAPSAMEMKPLFEYFRSTRPVYAPDLPGFGASERKDRDYSPQFFAETLCNFIEDIGARKIDVVALSLSSEFAARAAGLAPELFRSLALISPTGFSERPPMNEATGARIVRVLRTPLLGTGLFRLLTVKPSIRHFLGLNFHGPVSAEMVDYATTTAHRPGAIHGPRAFLSGKLFDADATRALYAPLQLPGLVIYDQDPNVRFDRLPGFVEEHANWRAVRIAPTLGLPHFEKLDEVASALQQFWAANA
jgi:pimeloyl-ACP methyl ester carboxylesterase